MTALLDEARSDLRATGRPTESVAWSALLDHTLLPLVASGRIDDARAALRSALGTDGDGPGVDHPDPRAPDGVAGGDHAAGPSVS